MFEHKTEIPLLNASNVTFSGILSSNAKHPVWINQQERIIYVSAIQFQLIQTDFEAKALSSQHLPLYLKNNTKSLIKQSLSVYIKGSINTEYSVKNNFQNLKLVGIKW